VRVWILGAVLALTIFLQQVLAIPPKTTYEGDQSVVEQIFEDACRISEYNCSGLEQPLVRRSNQLDPVHVSGLYAGGKILWINNQMVATPRILILFHEMIHYLQFNSGMIEPTMRGTIVTCIIEREAMELTNAYTLELNMPQLVRQVADWEETYGC
jgi:hypothetical protein